MRALVIEDEASIRRFIRRGLVEQLFVVEEAEDGPAGLAMARTAPFDVIILDLMLPGLSGFEVLSGLRSNGVNTPVICLTARDAVDDRVEGLNLGADDYMVKPFSFSELLARIRALQRRSPELRSAQVSVGDLAIDQLRRTVKRAGQRLDLSNREYALLVYLARHSGEVLTRTMILDNVWDVNHDPTTNVIDVHINRLRKKVDAGYDRRLIHTIRGVGYTLAVDPP